MKLQDVFIRHQLELVTEYDLMNDEVTTTCNGELLDQEVIDILVAHGFLKELGQ